MPIQPESLCEIWDRYSGRLAMIGRSFGDGAEDAVQEAFVELAKQQTVPADPLAWLVRVTRNRMLDRYRSDQRRQQREQRYLESRNETSRGASSKRTTGWVDNPLENAETNQQLINSIEQLPETLREVLVMHVWGEMTFNQIAQVLGQSSSQCHRHYQSAIRKMEVSLRAELSCEVAPNPPTKNKLVLP